MAEHPDLTVTLRLQEGYQFLVDFHQDGVPPLLMDESPPVGEGKGPTPSRALAAAVAGCLSASILYCLRKARVEVRGLEATVRVSFSRDGRGRLRVGGLQVTLVPQVAPGDRERMGRCLEVFEDYCVVTQSVRTGVPVQVEVRPLEAPQ